MHALLRGSATSGRTLLFAAALLSAVAATALAGFALTPGFTASFLTKKTAKQLFYTKTQSNSRYFTKAQADARFLPTDSATTINASPMQWEKITPAGPGVLSRSFDSTSLNSGIAGGDSLALSPELPSSLAGKAMSLTSVTACYSTPNASTLDAVQVYLTDGATASGTVPISDGTDRTDDACRTYVPSQPIALDADDSIALEYQVDFDGGGGNSFLARQASFTLQP